MNVVGPYIMAIKHCEICGEVGLYNASESDGPIGWIKTTMFGIRGHVCSMDCVNEAGKRSRAFKKQIDESRKEPLLPPEVMI